MTDTKTTAVFPLTREPALPEAASIAAAELPVIAVLVGLALTMQVAINIMIPALPALGAELGVERALLADLLRERGLNVKYRCNNHTHVIHNAGKG